MNYLSQLLIIISYYEILVIIGYMCYQFFYLLYLKHINHYTLLYWRMLSAGCEGLLREST